jgi:hypothetical protein
LQQLARALGTVRDSTRLIWLNLRGFTIFALNRFVNLAAVDRNLSRRFDSQSNPVAANVHDGDNYIVADNDAFIALTGENQHISLAARRFSTAYGP